METINVLDLFALQRGECFYCGRPITASSQKTKTSFTRDHFLPRKDGHKKNGNLVLACGPCNTLKGDRYPTRAETDKFNALYNKVKKRRADIACILKCEYLDNSVEETMEIWITKYALSSGVFSVDYKFCKFDRNVVSFKLPGKVRQSYSGHDWCTNRIAAVSRAREMRTQKVAALKKKIKRLQELRF